MTGALSIDFSGGPLDEGLRVRKTHRRLGRVKARMLINPRMSEEERRAVLAQLLWLLAEEVEPANPVPSRQ